MAVLYGKCYLTAMSHSMAETHKARVYNGHTNYRRTVIFLPYWFIGIGYIICNTVFPVVAIPFFYE